DVVVAPDNKASQWRISWKSAEPLTPGRWRLGIDYRGKVETRGQGLYLVEYRTAGRDTPRRMLATQLEPTHARAVFPSFDEPAFRATFDIVIAAPANFESVSNMPAVSQAVLADGRRETVFARSPSMPTYLVALAVGEFDALTDSFDGIALRILTAPGRAQEARYAMEVTKQLLGYYRDYFGVPYMLPKLDQLAIPGVRGGAMEDWGAISYNENLLLYDPKRSPPRQQQLIFAIAAHEIAHQWFGDLVTAAWWDDIWLNEAFATWMQNKTQAHFHPKWSSRVRERLSREEALALDAGKATRAVADPPAHESGIFEVFDEITYDKGGAVLGMFEAQLGEAVFRDGLRRYMVAHQYSNATADDLWYHLSQAAGTDLSPVIGGWIRQRGFPLLKVSTDCKDGRTRVDLSQERFTSTRTKELVAMWQVPVVVHAGESTKRLILGQAPQIIDFPGCVPVVANGGDTGYYRVQYDPANMARLRAAYADLPATERIGLVADTMALARSGRIEFAEYFRLLDAMRGEREGAVWQQVIENLGYLDDVFAGSPVQGSVRAYGRSLLRPVMVRLGWQPQPDEDAGTLRIRNALIDTLGRFDDEDTTARAKAMFAAYTATPSVPVEPSIRQGVVRAAARTADPETFEKLRRLLKDAGNQEDIYLYGGAMIVVRDPKLVQRILELGLSDEWPPGSASYYMRNVGYNSGHPGLARAFIVQNFEAVQAKASRADRPWILPAAYTGFNEQKEADALLAVQRRLLGEEAMSPAEQVAELIREKASVREREEKRLPELLQSLTKQKIAVSSR
ncbi:MAG: ERAP1-like C-terminal domain-containing protein, partial [Vicinamibacterales bacterium]|nr:ERAP1-like C-terminal domain-containing protein [Vicinamibacterales bacterium]